MIDSHIHLDFSAFDADRETLLQQARNKGITGFVVPATTRASWPKIAKLALHSPGVYPAFGIHPYFSQTHTLQDVAALAQHLQSTRCCALGEIGLDYFLPGLDRDHQMQLFEAQLALAAQQQLPLILHARKAVDVLTSRLKQFGLSQGIVHSFNGSYIQAIKLIDMGFKLGFGGPLTYSRASRLRALVKKLPLKSLCLETDAPDQPVASLQGQRNVPVALVEVLQCIAEIRAEPAAHIAHQCRDNTYAALNIC